MNEFETVVVNEPSVFESLKFYCIALVDGLVVFSIMGCRLKVEYLLGVGVPLS